MRAVLVVGWVWALAFSPAGAEFDRSQSASHEIPRDTLITLERTPCFGFCPSYKLTIDPSGNVVFYGKDNVKVTGLQTKKISTEQLMQLLAEFETAKFYSLKEKYVNPEDGCEGVVTDHPSAITSIRTNGKTKTVEHYYGCRGPKDVEVLTRLERRIDEIVNTAQWLR